jgi:hypothetical protein
MSKMKFDDGDFTIPKPRDGVIGESAFLDAAIKYFAPKPDDFLDDILLVPHGYSPPDFLRLVMWLGTDRGNEFLRGNAAASEAIESIAQRQGFWLAAWSVHNHRRAGRDGGYTLLELILGTERGPDGFPKQDPGWLEAEDIEMAQHFFWWLGSDDGYEFIVAAETELLKRRAQAGISGPSAPMIIEEGMRGVANHAP